MPRGGSRSGSGRKPSLEYLDQLDVGGECERRWLDLRQAQEDKALAAIYVGTEYSELIKTAHAVPLEDRVDRLTNFEGGDYRDDVDGALREMQGIDLMSDEAPARLRTIAVTRPYGARATIEREVAAWATERFGRTISVRTVRSCWISLRKLKTRLASV